MRKVVAGAETSREMYTFRVDTVLSSGNRANARIGRRHWPAWRLFIFFVGLCFGCSYSPSRLEQPSLKPARAAAQAIADYDKDGNSSIDAQELAASPALTAAMAQFDSNKDGQLTEAEISARLENWVASRLAVFPVPCLITLDGRPLPNAEVRFEPETFLGDAFQTFTITTNERGDAVIPNAPGMSVKGFPLGLYQVHISKIVDKKQIVPKKYNEATILGQEIAAGGAGMDNGIIFRLTSK